MLEVSLDWIVSFRQKGGVHNETCIKDRVVREGRRGGRRRETDRQFIISHLSLTFEAFLCNCLPLLNNLMQLVLTTGLYLECYGCVRDKLSGLINYRLLPGPEAGR